MVKERWGSGVGGVWSWEQLFNTSPSCFVSYHHGEKKVGRCLSRSDHDYHIFETIKNEPFQFHQKPILFLELRNQCCGKLNEIRIHKTPRWFSRGLLNKNKSVYSRRFCVYFRFWEDLPSTFPKVNVSTLPLSDWGFFGRKQNLS